MSGEDKTVGELLRYVDSDFNSGYSYFKSGINNVISALVLGKASTVIVNISISGFLLAELIHAICEDARIDVCDYEYVVFRIQGKGISVICRDTLKFILEDEKSFD